MHGAAAAMLAGADDVIVTKFELSRIIVRTAQSRAVSAGNLWTGSLESFLAHGLYGRFTRSIRRVIYLLIYLFFSHFIHFCQLIVHSRRATRTIKFHETRRDCQLCTIAVSVYAKDERKKKCSQENALTWQSKNQNISNRISPRVVVPTRLFSRLFLLLST